MSADVRIEQHMGLLRQFAGQVTRRMTATGSATSETFDDVVQECAIAWTLARDAWSPEHGVPFVAFLKRGMIQHVNRWAGKEIVQHNASHVDLDAPMGDTADDEDVHAILADAEAADPEETAILSQRRELALSKLSARARQFVVLLESPPQCLVEMVRAMAARRQYALARGLVSVQTPKRVMPALIFRFMGCSRVEQTNITREIETKFKVGK